MISSLYIKNLAIIEETTISFDTRFNVITGETGAGKSIVLDALALIGGNRAENELIGNFASKCIVEARFVMNDIIASILEVKNLDVDTELIVRRELVKNGKSRSFINDTPIQLSDLKSIMSELFYIHSQFSNQEFIQKKYQLSILDIFSSLEQKVNKYRLEFESFKNDKSILFEKKELYKSKIQTSDYNSFLLQEIEGLNIGKVDYAAIEEEINKAEYSEKIIEVINEIINLDNENGFLHSLNKIKSNISKISIHLNGMKNFENSLESIIESLRNLVAEAYSYDLEDSITVTKKNQLITQLDELNRLLNKHKVHSIESLLNVKNELSNEVYELDELKNDIQKFEIQIDKKSILLNELASDLHKDRMANLLGLESEIEKYFSALNMNEAKIKFELTKCKELNENGYTVQTLFVSLNSGHAFQPIEKVASGGELSRIALVIQRILTSKSKLPMVVFDEIDTGIGGETAKKVGEFISDISSNQQVIVITHFAQVASKADQHLLAVKTKLNEKTVSKIICLDNKQRELELAKMISGSSTNIQAIETAKTLLREDESIRN